MAVEWTTSTGRSLRCCAQDARRSFQSIGLRVSLSRAGGQAARRPARGRRRDPRLHRPGRPRPLRLGHARVRRALLRGPDGGGRGARRRRAPPRGRGRLHGGRRGERDRPRPRPRHRAPRGDARAPARPPGRSPARRPRSCSRRCSSARSRSRADAGERQRFKPASRGAPKGGKRHSGDAGQPRPDAPCTLTTLSVLNVHRARESGPRCTFGAALSMPGRRSPALRRAAAPATEGKVQLGRRGAGGTALRDADRRQLQFRQPRPRRGGNPSIRGRRSPALRRAGTRQPPVQPRRLLGDRGPGERSTTARRGRPGPSPPPAPGRATSALTRSARSATNAGGVARRRVPSPRGRDGDEEARLPVDHDLEDPAGRRGHDGRLAGHRLEVDDAQRLVDRRAGEHRRVAEQLDRPRAWGASARSRRRRRASACSSLDARARPRRRAPACPARRRRARAGRRGRTRAPPRAGADALLAGDAPDEDDGRPLRVDAVALEHVGVRVAAAYSSVSIPL